jgi:hypothetical protein
MTQRVTPVELVATAELSPVFATIAVRPPALTRLEPQSVSGDPAPGAVAAVADPLWMLGRQWQLGELLGEDVGTPVSVDVQSRALPVTAWAPAGDLEPSEIAEKAQWRAWPEGALLDELVEHVPDSGADEGLRWRAETGAQLAEMLREAGQGSAADQLLSDHPLVLPADPADPTGALDPGAERLFAVLEGRVPDGGAARVALEEGEPGWVSGAPDKAKAAAAAAEWLDWVTGQPGAGSAWSTPRLEHRFALRFGHGDATDSAVVAATAFGTGAARWHDFEWLDGWSVQLDGDGSLAAAASVMDTMLAAPLRYPGMPANRYWQLEDGAVDVSAIAAQPHDLARLCLAEFALVSGDDWLVVPVDGRIGALNQVQRVSVTNTFGETYDVAEDASGRRGRGFGMYEVTSGSGESLHGVLLPPVANTPLSGDPVEEVAFLRDESANLAWGVEKVVAGRSGDPRQRSAEPVPQRPAPPDDLADGDLLYELLVPIPASWIPLVPVSTGYAQVGLRKGALVSDGQQVLAASALLAPTPLTFPAEEIPREGVTVTAVPLLARRRDGSYARWTGHRVRVGRGEGSSGFASDTARETRLPGG